MAHARMFDDDDRHLARVREIAATLPGTAEKISHGRPVFYTKKLFAVYGGALKIVGEWVQHPHSIVVLTDPDERQALLHDERAYVPAYWGPSGWIGIDLDDGTDWSEIAELLDASFRLTASKRLVTELDAGSSL